MMLIFVLVVVGVLVSTVLEQSDALGQARRERDDAQRDRSSHRDDWPRPWS